ncbi:MAG: DedA family protein [Patescibacteria group bacterium]
MEQLIQSITGFVTDVISAGGYMGVGFLMALESSAIQIPSEIIMPFAGFLVSAGTFTLFGISFAGAVGSMIGSAVLYYIGYYGGRPVVEKYGKYFLINHKDLDVAENFFQKHGQLANFIGRFLPVVRTFISFPAGVARVKIAPFLALSFIGSFFWSLFLGFIGLKLGQNWQTIHSYFRGIDYVIVGLFILGLIYYIRRHLKH